jgi:recombinational DNA repair protein RecR
MTSLTPQFVLLTTGAGAMMILVGLSRGLLRARSVSRRCPSCDRLIKGRVCATCTGRGR